MRSTRQPNESFTSAPTNAAASTELNVCDGPERRPVTRNEGALEGAGVGADAGNGESVVAGDGGAGCTGSRGDKDRIWEVDAEKSSNGEGMRRNPRG